MEGWKGVAGKKMCAVLLFGDKAVLLRRYDIRVKHMLKSSACSTFLCLSLMDFAARGVPPPPAPPVWNSRIDLLNQRELSWNKCI